MCVTDFPISNHRNIFVYLFSCQCSKIDWTSDCLILHYLCQNVIKFRWFPLRPLQLGTFLDPPTSFTLNNETPLLHWIAILTTDVYRFRRLDHNTSTKLKQCGLLRSDQFFARPFELKATPVATLSHWEALYMGSVWVDSGHKFAECWTAAKC